MTDSEAAERSRTFSWEDPAASLAHIGNRSGLEVLRAFFAGAVPMPPVLHMLGVEGVEAHEGRAVFRMPAGEFLYNALGTVSGGAIAALLDTAAGCAVLTTLPAGTGYTSLDLATKFLRPATIDSGLLQCEGTMISRGRTTALAEARVTDPTGRLLAHATTTCLIFPVDQGVVRD